MAKLVERPREELKAILHELSDQTDRGTAIIASAILEDLLTVLLKNRLILTTRLEARLFSHEHNGPLSAFNAKIDVAFAVGILKGTIRDELHIIRRIRNRFAHTIEPITFADPTIAAWCATIPPPFGDEPIPFIPRLRFFEASLVLSATFIVACELDIGLSYIGPEIKEQRDKLLNEVFGEDDT